MNACPALPRRTEERRGSNRSSSYRSRVSWKTIPPSTQDHRHDPQEDTLQQRRVLLRDPEARGLRRGHVFSGEGLGGVRSPERGVEGRGVPTGVPGCLRHRGDRRYVLRSSRERWPGRRKIRCSSSSRAAQTPQRLADPPHLQGVLHKFGNINATNFCQKRTDGGHGEDGQLEVPDAAQEDGVANEAPKKRGAVSTATPSRGPRVGTITRRGPTVDEMTFHGDDVLVVRERHAVHRGLRRGDRRTPSGHPLAKYLLHDKYEAEKDKRTRGGQTPPSSRSGSSAPRSSSAQLVRGVRDRRPEAPAAIPETSAKYLEDDNVDAKIGPLRPRRSGRVRLAGLQRGREARGHQHELGEPQREVGGLGVQEATEEDSGWNQYVIPACACGGASRVLKKICDTYNMGTETPIGYRLVRRRERARAHPPHAGTRGSDDTPEIRHEVQREAPRQPAYHREYYRRKCSRSDRQ